LETLLKRTRQNKKKERKKERQQYVSGVRFLFRTFSSALVCAGFRCLLFTAAVLVVLLEFLQAFSRKRISRVCAQANVAYLLFKKDFDEPVINTSMVGAQFGFQFFSIYPQRTKKDKRERKGNN
jgi:hypothetical protein